MARRGWRVPVCIQWAVLASIWNPADAGLAQVVGVPWSDQTKESEVQEDGITADIKKLCPLTTSRAVGWVQWFYSQIPMALPLLGALGYWPANITPDTFADEYFIVNYLGVGRILLRLYKARDSSYAYIPHGLLDPEDVIHVENVYVPHYDVDASPNFYWFEWVIPGILKRRVYVPLMTCFYSSLRRLGLDTRDYANGKFSDALDDPDHNTWDAVMRNSKYKTKREWMMSFWDGVNAWDGSALWPEQQTDFGVYKKGDEWDDRLEYVWAFHLIGLHRLEHGSWVFRNAAGFEKLTLPYRVPLNAFAAFAVRDGFGRFGVDLYFNEDGMPVLLQTPYGEYVARGDRTWQYWKFVWRSTLITGITIVDHLHFTHFRAGNLLARSSRVALPPDNPLRRLLSIFTFGTIFVNVQATHQLVGPKHGLHRAVPFRDFEKLSRVVPDGRAGMMMDVVDAPGIRQLLHEDAFKQMPEKMQDAPYFSDGKLLISAERKLVNGFMNISEESMCNEDGTLSETIHRFLKEVVSESKQAKYKMQEELAKPNLSCSEYKSLFAQRLLAYIYLVTGFHRHVGFVGDYYNDPALATMSWKEGEPYGRPKQHMLMTVVNVFTSTKQPKLKEDYTHLFKGMNPDRGAEMTKLWKEFLDDLQAVEDEIDRRNKKRDVINMNASPKYLDSSIAK